MLQCRRDLLRLEGSFVLIAFLLSLPSPSRARQYEFNDDNIRQAVDAWLEDNDAAAKQYGPIQRWQTWQVTDMSRLFQGATDFNENLKYWDTTSVTDMHHIFAGATKFEGFGLSNWKCHLVTDFSHAFYGATSFVGDNLGTWNTSSAITMEQMFLGATNFIGPENIEDWDVSSVTSMYAMFFEATSFDRPVNNWDMTNVRYTNSMFDGASSFSQQTCWNRMDSYAKCFQCFCGTSGANFDMSSDCPVAVHPSILAYSQACDPDDVLDELVDNQVFHRPVNDGEELELLSDTYTEGVSGLPMLDNPSVDGISQEDVDEEEEEELVEEVGVVGVDRSDTAGGGAGAESIEVGDRGDIMVGEEPSEESELIIAGVQREESAAAAITSSRLRRATEGAVMTIPPLVLVLLSVI